MHAVATSILLLAAPVFAGEPPEPAVGAPLVVKSVSVRGTTLHVNLATQVGELYDAGVVGKDVRNLWSTGRFEDIRVESAEEPEGAAVVFHVLESRPLRLHEIRIEPSSFGLKLALPEGTPLNRTRAHEIALEARKQLQARGYLDAQVDYGLTPFSGSEVDLRLSITASGPVRVKEVTFAGNSGVDSKELRRALRTIKIRRVLGWPLFPTYSPDAVDADLARLRSLFLSKGYFDADARVDGVNINGRDARIRVVVQSGPLYRVRNSPWPIHDLCPCLFAARCEAERQGVLDFSASLIVQPIEADSPQIPVADLVVNFDRGRPYRVGRIDFSGNRHYSDATVRRSFLLDEGGVFDERLLRKSIARLNQSNLFEPINIDTVAIHQNEKTGVADVHIRLTERKRGAWRLSGPVGPASFAGPLQASLSSRLPPWGAGLLELSTYTASLSLFAFARPVLPILSVASKSRVLPVLALERPFSPAEGWKSGFVVAPGLGWRVSALGYASTQIQQRVQPLLAGDRGLTPELAVTVERPSGEVGMLCEPAPPRFAHLRRAATVSLQLLGTLAAF